MSTYVYSMFFNAWLLPPCSIFPYQNRLFASMTRPISKMPKRAQLAKPGGYGQWHTNNVMIYLPKYWLKLVMFLPWNCWTLNKSTFFFFEEKGPTLKTAPRRKSRGWYMVPGHPLKQKEAWRRGPVHPEKHSELGNVRTKLNMWIESEVFRLEKGSDTLQKLYQHQLW